MKDLLANRIDPSENEMSTSATPTPEQNPPGPPEPRLDEREPSYLETHASLLKQLKDIDDQTIWQEFFQTYWRLIDSTARKAGLTPEEAKDAVQETFVAVAKHIGEFRYDPTRCSFKSWLLLITRQRIIWQLRKRPKHPAEFLQRGADDISPTEPIERIPDPAHTALDCIWETEWRDHLLSRALERVKGQVSARQFQVFDLLVLQRWSVSDVVRTLHVNASQVYLAKHRVGSLVRKAVRALERENP
jgi:RNA polymerase sigma factor (sigma-70 family)